MKFRCFMYLMMVLIFTQNIYSMHHNLCSFIENRLQNPAYYKSIERELIAGYPQRLLIELHGWVNVAANDYEQIVLPGNTFYLETGIIENNITLPKAIHFEKIDGPVSYQDNDGVHICFIEPANKELLYEASGDDISVFGWDSIELISKNVPTLKRSNLYQFQIKQ